MPSHPSTDRLADLAAGVLADPQAREVEAHLVGCPRCQSLLDDADHVRALLLADDPGPMPDDVWSRLSGALAEQARDRAGAAGPPPADDDPAQPSPDLTARLIALPENQDRQEDRHDAGGGRVVPLLPRPRRPGSTRLAPLLVAAAVVAVAVVGALNGRLPWQAGPRGAAATTAAEASASMSSSAASGVSSDQAGGGTPAAIPPLTTREVASGTAYTSARLPEQVTAQLRSYDAAAGPKRSGAHGAGSATPATPAPSALQAAVGDVTACLALTGATNVVLVDVARYDDQDAVIVVGDAPSGGRSVWVVTADCRSGQGHVLATRPL